MAKNSITLTFAGDSKSLDRTFDNVGDGAKAMAKDLDSVDDATGRFGAGISSMNGKIDTAEGKFMGTADLLDGMSSAFGINTHGVIDMARAYGDMAGGFAATVGPALETMSGKLGKLSIVTKAQTAATAAMNAVMAANPVLLVVLAIAALTAGLVIAYKKSETFRDIVNGAFSAVKAGASALWGTVSDVFDKIGSVATSAARTMGKVADIITAPYRLAFRAIADLWNATVGKLSFKAPGWVPIVGGKGWDVPDIPTFAKGGRFSGGPMIVGERGPELLTPGFPGQITPNGAMGGGAFTLEWAPTAGGSLISALQKEIRIRGGNVQSVLGA